MAYGCSYTAGTELLDHELDPRADLIKRTQGMAAWYQHRKQCAKNWTKLETQQKSLVWAAQLAKLLDLDFLNRSRAGTSLCHHLYQIEHDLAQGKINDRDLVMVGITNHARTCVFADHTTDVGSWLIADTNTWPNPQWHGPTVLDLYTDRRLGLDHLGYLLQLAQLPKVYLVYMEGRHGLVRDPVIDQRHQRLMDTGRVLAQAQSLMDQAPHPAQSHAGGHPKISAHQALADLLLPQVTSMVRSS